MSLAQAITSVSNLNKQLKKAKATAKKKYPRLEDKQLIDSVFDIINEVIHDESSKLNWKPRSKSSDNFLNIGDGRRKSGYNENDWE